MATEAEYRSALGALMDATVEDEAAGHYWTYRAVRPMPVPPAWHAGDHIEGDCSKGCQYQCRWVSLPDPMHADYDPYGNSTTLWLQLVHIDLQEVQIGDLVVFGINGSEHAAMVKKLVKKNGKVTDLVLWSFGFEGAPNFYKLSQDPRVWQCLRLRVMSTSQKIPADVLVAKEGYGSWRQWRLGTGSWRGYGKRNRAVRPNVPHRIPLAWWRMFFASLRQQRSRRPNPVTPATLAASGGSV
jgi:hypothetical protein